MSSAGYAAMAGGNSFWEKLKRWTPIFVIAPAVLASFVYVFVFSGWTMYISLSDSTLLPTYGFKGLENYASLWANRRWGVGRRDRHQRGGHLRGLCDLVRPDAARADADALGRAVHDCPHGLQIHFEAARADIVGVGHRTSDHRALVADFTASRHDESTFQETSLSRPIRV